MPAPAPHNVPLSDLRSLLLALESAGVPLGLEAGWRAADDELARRVASGESLDSAVESSVPAAASNYGRLVRLVAAGVPAADVLERLHSEALLQATAGSRLARGFLYPLVVAAVAAGGLLLLGWTVLPLVEASYADLRKPPGVALRWMLAIRDSAPVWLAAGPLVIGAACWLASKAKPLRWTRGSVESGPTARLRYGAACHDEAALREVGKPLIGDGPAPRLLAWARETGAPATDLRAIGRAYDHLARNGTQAYAAWTPLAATVLIGGGTALVYALALFAPLAELLWTLAS